MKTVIASAVLALALSGPAFAQKQQQKQGSGATCSQRCQNYCNANRPNQPQCIDQCTLRQCNR